ncbi:hypothetical protein CBS63078_5156 [Aspergillus niger]|nr:hypothetical protein CBS13152_8017 [Aspergillus niger]KAI2906668.1 hypothetical protein CBS63078_5156 [Aspergillus niger]KAI2958523.1 hypothetical protein CBS147323_8661 [Aspergillus niger]KAI3022434.1 hypothetical protein CBS147347_7329 [Aspergillus niger]KAI3031912.1 hypothetical protein CBS147345_1478 [Aspergillus niger]
MEGSVNTNQIAAVSQPMNTKAVSFEGPPNAPAHRRPTAYRLLFRLDTPVISIQPELGVVLDHALNFPTSLCRVPLSLRVGVSKTSRLYTLGGDSPAFTVFIPEFAAKSAGLQQGI